MKSCHSAHSVKEPYPNAIGAGYTAQKIISEGILALVVDDCPLVREFAATMLAKLSYKVHKASEGCEALLYLKESSCQLVLTDYEMPAINGFQLGLKIKNLFPETRVVIMTGLDQASVTDMVREPIIDAWLFKPFGMQEFKRALEMIGLPVPEGQLR